MSDGRDAERRSALAVARVGGGRSARVGALVVVGVLVAVVGVGLSGRPPSPPVAAESPPLAGAAPRSEPSAAPVATGDSSPPPRAVQETYSVSATIGRHSHLAVLEEVRPGYMFATLRVPFPPEATEGTLEIAQLRVNDVAENTIAVSDWALSLGPLASVRGEPGIVIDAYVAARPNLRNVSAAVRSGYHLTVYAENDLLFGLLSIEMTLGNGLSAPVAVASAHGLSVVATFGSRQFMTLLQEDEAGHLRGALYVPVPVPGTEGTLQLVQVWTTVSHDAWSEIDSWELRLDSLSAGGGREYVILDASVPQRPTSSNVPAPVSRGYQIVVHAQSGPGGGLVSVDIRPRPRHQASIPEPQPPPFANPGTRPRPRFSNECRWDAPIPPSPSGPVDEASC